MPEIIDTKTVYVTFTNSDLTEGRGYQIPIHVCESPTTAVRVGLKKYVMGSNCPTKSIEMIRLDKMGWYISSEAIQLIKPSKEDNRADEMNASAQAAYNKAKSLGMTDDDIKSLMGHGKD